MNTTWKYTNWSVSMAHIVTSSLNQRNDRTGQGHVAQSKLRYRRVNRVRRGRRSESISACDFRDPTGVAKLTMRLFQNFGNRNNKNSIIEKSYKIT